MSAMRHFRFVYPAALLLALCPLTPSQPAMANETRTIATTAETPSRENRLDTLFDALKRERNADKAQGIASQIWSEWNNSESATINLLMKWADEAIKGKRNAAALDFLDRITLMKPDYAEAWNRRATLYYTMGQPRKAMADINQTLQREPRHFGALAGMAGILTEAGRDELALKAWERYLAIYPSDRQAQEQVTRLSEKLAGSRT